MAKDIKIKTLKHRTGQNARCRRIGRCNESYFSGPKGRNVIISKILGAPTVTEDRSFAWQKKMEYERALWKTMGAPMVQG